MKFSFADNTGFSVLDTANVSSESLSKVSNPAEMFDRTTGFGSTSRKDKRIYELIKKATVAYLVDSLYRQAIDKYSELFLDFDIRGKEQQVNYVKGRLNLITLQTGEHWKTTLTRAINEYFKTGNSFYLKTRGSQKPNGRRPLYTNRPYSISGLFLVSADLINPISSDSGKFAGWVVGDSNGHKKHIETVTNIENRLDDAQALITITNLVPEDKDLLFDGPDILHIAYKKPADTVWGVGLGLPALEDVSLLRVIEQNVATLIRKGTFPIIHHKILKAANALSGIQIDIQQAAILHQRSAPEGVLITGPNHEITAIGAENQALRLGEYLQYFSARVFSGLGVSPYIMGFEAATLGTAEAAQELLLSKIRFCQREIARHIEMFIFNELLWEGGWDPYTNEEDAVRLVFEDVDQNRKIKLQTHYADMWTKNFVGRDEARVSAEIEDSIKDPDTFVRKVQIPLAIASEEAKAKAAQKFPAPVAKNSLSERKIRSEIANFIPHNEKQLDLFLKELINEGFNEEFVMNNTNTFRALLGDDEAITELLVSGVQDDE